MAQKLFETNLTHGPYDNVAEAAEFAALYMDQIRLNRAGSDTAKGLQPKLAIVMDFLENYPRSQNNTNRGIEYGCALLRKVIGVGWAQHYGKEPKFSEQVSRETKKIHDLLNTCQTALEFGQPIKPDEATEARELLLALKDIVHGIDRQSSGPRY